MKKFYSLVISLVLLASLGMAQKAPTGDIWLHMLTTGQPAATRFLGDQLNSSGSWYVNFEVGQTVWHQTDAGIGQSNTDPSAWTWTTAIQYEIGSGNNRRVRSDLGNFRFTQTGTWYFAGRAKGDAGDPFHYANTDVWGNNSTFAPIYYFTVNALNDPSSQTATRNTTNPTTAIDLSWTKDGQSHNVMIVRKKVGESWTEPIQGTAYIVGNSLGSGVVVYNGSGTSYTDSGLNPATGYEYKFYSENFSYYSPGVTTAAVYTAMETYTVGGGGAYCTGGTGVNITLSGSDLGVSYQLLKGIVAAGAPKLGTGNPLTFSNVTEAGSYTIEATQNSEILLMSENPVIITEVPAPTAFVSSTSPLIIIGEPYPLNEASATNYTSLLWTHTGVGTFSNDLILNPTYTGTSSPVPPGYTTLTLTATNSGCSTSASAQFVLSPGSDNLVWTGFTSSDWFTGSNWNPGVIPGSVTDVTIPSGLTRYPIVGSAASCHNLTLESGASILDNENLTVTGTTTLNRTIGAGSWHLISIPNASTTASIFDGDYLQTWDETNADWIDIVLPSTQLSPKIGYGLWGTSGDNYSLTGAYLTGNQSTPITYTELPATGNDGANLLGNPYPSYIDWNGLRTSYSAVYYWNGTAYVSWNNGGDGSRFVAPMQGFFIVTGSPGTFSLTNSNRTNTTGTFYKSALAENSLVLETVSQSYSDKIFLSFNPETTESFDLANDAYKFMAGTTGLSQIYSYTADGEKKLSIDVRPESEVVQLGFFNDQSGEYSIGINQMNSISKAILEDKKTGTLQNLFDGSYKFDYTAGEDDKRFLLHFSTTGLDETKTKAANIYSYQKTVYVNVAEQTEGDIYIYNIAGQLVASKPSARGMNEIGVQVTGNYIVKVITKGSTVVEKVFVQ